MKLFCIILVLILEVPFVIKLLQAKYDIICQTAILIIMLLIPLVMLGLYKLLMFVLK